MGAVARGPSAPLRVNPSRLRVNEWGERNSRREADPSAAVGMGDDTGWGGGMFRNRWWPRKIAILRIEDAMTVTLKLKPEVEAGLLRQAQASGMTLEE